ncbi:methyltransferase regulatory domain-containing protein [Thauera aromatica]|uniref:Putative methyltransferase n=1 Tax=Thauera aromatica K172 TaxID=44139 RepID=A0A2R4BJ45_THAAR|nr:class I SAM-dependent methyltransferase [Thauera aromatica]AVR87319.1 putative methyltransferase [Thauera aromatica K172]
MTDILPSHTENLESMIQEIADSYDRNQYLSHAFFFTAPAYLRATAWLYGVETAPVETARVLELGCSAGGNLLPFALSYPNATAVGVDLSSEQIRHGQKIAANLGAGNLSLHAMDLTQIDNNFGQFDYIIAHGVFSWVPPEVKQAILRICRENLSPQGIACVSYNTYPGWKVGDIVRDAMQIHSHGADCDADRLARAKAMLTLLSEGVAVGNTLAPALKSAVAKLRKHSDHYLAHEYLELHNTPCYFIEFAEAAQQAGLAYVGDAEAFSEMNGSYGRNVQLNHSLIALGQPKVLRQQYLDFAICRNFRKSLLIDAKRHAAIGNDPDLGRLTDLRFAGRFTETGRVDNAPKPRLQYKNHKEQTLTTNDAVIEAVMRSLTDTWPRSQSVDALLDAPIVATALARTAPASPARERVLASVRTLYQMGMLYITRDGDPYAEAKPGLPALTPGCRLLTVPPDATASVGATSSVGVFNLWHDACNPGFKPAERWLLPYLDGTHTEAQLRALLRDALTQGRVPATDGRWLTGQRNLDARAQSMVRRLLDFLHEQGLLR